MRPLPRLHAITDATVITDPAFGARLAGVASAGAAVALHARDRNLSGAALTALAERMMAHAAAPEAAVLVSGRPDIARAVGAHGVQLGQLDLAPADARTVMPGGWIGRSVHAVGEARQAVDEGADFLMVGNIFETTTHPGRPAAGTALIEQTARLGIPVIAIGGITAPRVRELRDAGAYGIAALSAVWHADDAAAATVALLEPWVDA